MVSLTSKSQIVAGYLGFIDVLGRRLREGVYGVEGTPFGTISDFLPGLEPLLNSLVAASPTARKVSERFIEDWNPFAQRILLSDEAPTDSTAFERDFSLVASYAQTLVEWGHEAVHILALEPWLSGRRKICSESEFVTWNLASEALAFWYADIVLTRKIRETIPEAELIYCRQSVSNTAFHPEQAFRRLGLSESKEILPLYIAAFLGKDIRLQSGGHPFSTVLANRLSDFYSGTTVTLKGLYSVLAMFDLFEGFYSRFCAIPHLPSLIGEQFLSVAWEVEDFHVRLGTEILPSLRELGAERVQLIRARRRIQTRAYYAWFLRKAIEKHWVFGNTVLALAPISAALDTYLGRLEDAPGPPWSAVRQSPRPGNSSKSTKLTHHASASLWKGAMHISSIATECILILHQLAG